MSLGNDAGVAVDMLAYLFESGIFSIIFAMSMRGMGAHTKTASAFMTAAISGGAIFPVIQTVVWNHTNLRYSYCVATAVFAFGIIFPIYLNLVPAAKVQVDPIHEKRIKRRNERKALSRQSTAEDPGASQRTFGLAGILARRSRNKMEQPSSQHVERRSETSNSSPPPTPIEKREATIEKTTVPRSPSPVRQTHDPGQTRAFSPRPATEVSEGGPNVAPDLSLWPDDDDDVRHQEILFGKSISDAL